MYLTVVYLNTTQGYRLSKGHRPNLKRLLHHLVRATFSLADLRRGGTAELCLALLL